METIERGTSLCNITPRGNNVLIKMNFRASILSLNTGKYDAEKDANEEVKFTVAGIGPNVKDLVLGEEILFKPMAAYEDVPVEGNHNSIKELTEVYKAMKPSEIQMLLRDGKNKVDVVQYGMFPEFQIQGHIEHTI
ncbi:MAG: hypothetical protein M0R17_08015 [Candidatus Omnitrophica bacterium]|jgi:hypothetical protein|nr:hypothetical protein [Candidatus Omnitrophota bacterium]